MKVGLFDSWEEMLEKCVFICYRAIPCMCAHNSNLEKGDWIEAGFDPRQKKRRKKTTVMNAGRPNRGAFCTIFGSLRIPFKG